MEPIASPTPSRSTPAPTTALDWNPMAYVRTASFVSRLPGADLLCLLGPIAGERILDIGSGTGELAGRIAAAGAEVVGVDASPAMVAEARRAVPEARFFVRDAQSLWPDPGVGVAQPSAAPENPRSPGGERDDQEPSSALRPASFDAVFSNAALHWMPRMADAASGIARALRPGGRVVAEMGGAGCVETIRQAVLETLRAHGGESGAWQPWVFPDLATYAGVLASAGLSPTLMQLFERPTPVAGADGLRDWLQVFAPAAFDQLDVPAETARAEAVERCRARLWDGSAWVLDYVRLRFVARKP